MDNTSFAPGNNSINNSVPPPTPQYSAPEPKHFLNKKFAITFVILILLGSGAYAGIRYWGNRQYSFEEMNPVFTPTPNEISDWKTYTNTQYGFSFKYPAEWVSKEYRLGTVFELALDPQKVISQKEWETLDLSAGMVTLYITPCDVPDKEACHPLGYNEFEKVAIGPDKISARRYVSATDLNPPNPSKIGIHGATYYVDLGKNTNYVLRISYGSGDPDQHIEEFNSILSTFKFTDSADTSTWKTYTNTKYGFSFMYPHDKFILNASDGIDYENTILQDKSQLNNNPLDDISVVVKPNPSKQSLKQWLSKNRTDIVISDKGVVTVGGVTGLQYVEGGIVNFLNTYITYNNNVIEFSIAENSKNISDYNRILSTFKFTQ